MIPKILFLAQICSLAFMAITNSQLSNDGFVMTLVLGHPHIEALDTSLPASILQPRDLTHGNQALHPHH